MDLSKLIDVVKLSPRYVFPFLLISSCLLFVDKSVIVYFGLETFVNQYRPWIGVIFLISASLLLSDAAIRAFEWFLKRLIIMKRRNGAINYLHKLSREQKNILLFYILNETRTQELPINGVSVELETWGIIYQSSIIGEIENWPFNLQPWAFDYLKKHKNEVFSKEDIEKYSPY